MDINIDQRHERLQPKTKHTTPKHTTAIPEGTRQQHILQNTIKQNYTGTIKRTDDTTTNR
jgi:hypothetical protein